LAGKPVFVAGAGSWGTALAIVLARNDHAVYLWDIDSELIHSIKEKGQNERYLGDIFLSERIIPTTDFEKHLDDVQDLVIAVPCNGLRSVLNMLVDKDRTDINICIACKGLEQDTQLLNHQVVNDCLDDDSRTAVLSGPSFAAEVARGLPTAVAITSREKSTAEYFATLFHSEVFRIYTQDDIIGVEIGGAVKNVMAIATGIADGLGFGANTRAALITRGLVEIIRLGVALGGKPETFMGLTGLGDLVLTCTDDQSRNRRLGLALAEGNSLEYAQQQIGQEIEGAHTTGAVITLAKKLNIDMPITEQVQGVLEGKITPKDAVQILLARDPKEELIS
jgi:glycerol-3-phosphate dehydrogenase (NAD(P)+)